MRTLLLPCVWLSLTSLAAAQVLRVPAQHKTIAAALAAANKGTTILVAAGTYKENLTWPSVDGIRLISESGAAQTTIDGGKNGRVITMSGKLTGATVIEGFTIAGGRLTGSRNDGAGILIGSSSGGCSPTIDGNRITGNESDGTSWNYGGGIHVQGTGSNPVIAGNTIDKNQLKNGSWNYGAGIYIRRGARPLVIGNTITANQTLSPSNSTGNRGYGAGVYVGDTASPVIASNLIAGNGNQTTSWNYGAGVAVAISSGTTVIANNTIVQNTCKGGSWTYGGGIYLYPSGGSVVITGNIVALNSCGSSNFVQGGGVYANSQTGVTLDWNDVWNNTGGTGNYQGISAGTNDISKDPMFQSATDYHLTKSSPCLDAMPATSLPASVDVDVDGDPRRIDGNLDGLSGNGARLDIGADELTDASLTASGPAKLGTKIDFVIGGPQPSFYASLLDLGTGNLVVEPFGNFLLSLSFVPVGGGVAPGKMPWVIPNIATLVGVTTYHQAVVLPSTKPGRGQLTDRMSLTMH